jgi:AcrR family transcriptional regulator
MTKKKDILDTATRLLAIKGYKQTSMAELAKLTGVAHGTIFYHYKNKEELFLAILKAFESDILSEYQRHHSALEAADGLSQMEAAVAFYFELAAQMADRFLLLHRHDAYEFSQVNPTCRRHLESIYDCLVGLFEGAMTAGQADGSIAADLSPRRTALLVFTLVDGLVRFNTYSLYDAGSLYGDLIASLRRMIRPNAHQGG